MSAPYRDLFGDAGDVQPAPSRRRKPRPRWRGLYYDAPGTGPAGQTCRTCCHARRIQPSARAFYKCARHRDRWTNGQATDILVRAPACSGWEARP